MEKCPGDRLPLAHTCTLQSKKCLKRRKQIENEDSGYYAPVKSCCFSTTAAKWTLEMKSVSEEKIRKEGIEHTRKK